MKGTTKTQQQRNENTGPSSPKVYQKLQKIGGWQGTAAQLFSFERKDGAGGDHDGREETSPREKVTKVEEETRAFKKDGEMGKDELQKRMQRMETRLKKLEDESGSAESAQKSQQDGRGEQGLWQVDEKEERLKEAELKIVTLEAMNQMLWKRIGQLEVEKREMVQRHKSDMMDKVDGLKKVEEVYQKSKGPKT